MTFSHFREHVASAMELLTLFHVGSPKHTKEQYPVLFPFIGLFVGGLLCAVYAASFLFFSQSVALLITIFAYVIVTGAKHVDDYADMIDALMGGNDPEERRRIADDSRAGTSAIVGIVFLLLLYVQMLSEFRSDIVFFVLLTLPMIARWSILPITIGAKEQGGKEFRIYTRYDFPVVTLVTAVFSYFILGWQGPVIMIVIFLLTRVLSDVLVRLMGEMRWDIRGFLIEVNSIVSVLLLYILTYFF